MAKFGINDILNAKSRAEAGTAEAYKEIWLSPYDVKPAMENTHQKLEGIEELADNFLLIGQEQPTVLARVNGEFRIIDGHRRNEANIFNLERGHEKYSKVKYRYRDMTETMYEIALLAGNGFTQGLKDYEKARLVERLKKALTRAKEKGELEIKGKMRDFIADITGESSSNIARMEKINGSLVPEAKEAFKKGSLGITAAYEISRLTEEEQKEIAEKAKAGEEIRAKEIAKKVAQKVAEEAQKKSEKAQERAEIAKVEADKAIEEALAKQTEAQEEARNAEELRNYVERKGAEDSIARSEEQKKQVSESDTMESILFSYAGEPKEAWAKEDWTAYIIVELYAVRKFVSEDNLCKLKEILTETKEGARKNEKE